jgi:DNA-binding transcriptional LysR family regulator
MIDRYHLRYFLAVIDTGNFSRAAAACNVSQPSLSVGIAKLEAQLGAPLFRRTSKRVALTEAGGRLAAHARAIEAGFAQAERVVAGSDTAATIKLGVLASTPRHWTEQALALLAGTRVELVEGRERELLERLARGRIDAALTIVRAGEARFGARVLASEGYTLALSAAHPLAARESIAAEELVGDAMIVRRHCEALSETSRFFTARGVRPFFPARTTSDDRALGYVRAGLGVTVMPDGFREPGVARVPIEGFDLVRDIGLLVAPHADAAAVDGIARAFETVLADEAALTA